MHPHLGGGVGCYGGRPAQHQHLSLDRRKQINTLLIFNENVTEVSPNHQYRIDFVSQGQPLAMIVTLPPEFPLEKPIVQLEPEGFHHPWLDQFGRVIGAPGLQSFGTHSDLGRVIQVIKREFVRTPPTTSCSYQANGFLSSNSADSSSPYNVIIAHPTLPKLAEMSLQELQTLESDDKMLKGFCASLLTKDHLLKAADEAYLDTKASVAELMRELKQTAKRVEEKKALMRANFEEFNVVQSQMETVRQQFLCQREKLSWSYLRKALKASCDKAEEASEACAESFVAGEREEEPNAFVVEYLKRRTEYHKKKVRLDHVEAWEQQHRMEQMRRQQSRDTTGFG